MIICKNIKVIVPKIIQKYIVDWYHTYLLHLGPKRTEATISQHYYPPKLRDEIRTHINVCSICQKKETKPQVWHITR